MNYILCGSGKNYQAAYGVAKAISQDLLRGSGRVAGDGELDGDRGLRLLLVEKL